MNEQRKDSRLMSVPFPRVNNFCVVLFADWLKYFKIFT